MTKYAYDETGQVTTMTPAVGAATQYTYTDNYSSDSGTPTGNTNIFPTKITRGTLARTYQFGFNDGKLRAVKDENGNLFHYCYMSSGCSGSSFDPWYRLTEADNPDGGSTRITYNDAGPTPSTVVSSTVNSSTSMSTTTTLDAAGHTTKTALTSDPQGTTYVNTVYDGRGRVYTATNPFRSTSDPSYGITTHTYDALGRETLLQQPDTKGTQTWNYSGGNTIIATDEKGNQWQRSYDVLGRLGRVLEPNGSQAAPSLETDYVYDGLGNLTFASQKGTGSETPRTRNFTYDSISRLVTAKNPETGSVCYGTISNGVCQEGYDANGRLTAKTDANGMTISYGYDGLDRLVRKTAPDNTNTNVYMIYDQGTNGLGRLYEQGNTNYTNAPLYNGMIYAEGGARYSYDAMGRVAGTTRFSVGLNSWQPGFTATYDFLGNLATLTYPDGRVIQETSDGANRLSSLSDVTPGITSIPYMNGGTSGGVQYWPSGQEMSAVLGGVVGETGSINARLQPCRITAAMTVGNKYGLFDHQSYYNPALSAPCGQEAANNGNMFAIVDNLQVGWTQSFGYDTLNRLKSASRSDGGYNYTYNYDSFGNLITQDNLHSNLNWSIDPATNRMLLNSNAGMYDNAGQLVQTPNPLGGTHSIYYTAQGFIRGIDNYQLGSYVYDGADNRVMAVRNTGPTTDYVYFGGQPMAEYTMDGVWTDYIYADGKKIAKVSPNGNVLHLSGSTQAGTGAVSSGAPLSSLNGVLVKTGDVIDMWQYTTAENGAAGGIWFSFVGGDYSTSGARGVLYDSDGQLASLDGIKNSWHHRRVDISQFQNLTINSFSLLNERNGSTGQFDEFFADIALHRAAGTVLPIWAGSPYPTTMTAVVNGPGQATAQVGAGAPVGVDSTVQGTHLYVDDHLGTTQVEVAGGGWPVWQGQFTPFGQEIVGGGTQMGLGPTAADGSPMRYKFTGKERDSESGLDYFGARYYAGYMGRWTTPDWAEKPEAVPYSVLDDPQSLNLYSYVRNNPLSRNDPTGHFAWDDSCNEPCKAREALDMGGNPFEAIQAARSQTSNASRVQRQQAAPKNPDGSAKAPPTKDTKGNSLLPDGKNGQPNSWVPADSGNGSRQKWKPKLPVPSSGGGQPSASWDDDNGHWDVKPGTGGKPGRYLPDGTPVDHWSNPITTRGVLGTAGAVGAGYLIYRGLRMLPSLAPPLWWSIPLNAAIP